MQSSERQFSRIFESGEYLDLLELSDANLRTEDGCNFNIHKVILAKSTDYFRRMFLGMGKRRRKIRIPGISGECLSDILYYIYTKQIRITDRNIADLIVGADYLLMEDLQMRIRGCIKNHLTEFNCLRIFLAAYQTSDESILRACFRFIQTRFERIMRCPRDDLVHLPMDILERILGNRSLYVYNETTVWQAIVSWTQEDTALRMGCVPRLLLTLATEDMGEELAREILQHEIISQNCFVKDLAETASPPDFSPNLEALLMLLRSYSDCFTKPILRHRIPLQLFLAFSYTDGRYNLYVSYDGNVDLWRKVTEVRYWPIALIAVGHHMYSFYEGRETYCKLDLRTMNWERMPFKKAFRIPNGCYFVATDAYIYVLVEKGVRIRTYDVRVCDTVNNKWRKGVPLRNISHVAAVAIEENIYVLGNSETSEGMMMQMFDPVKQCWSIMSPPTVQHSKYSVVAYHQKIYLIGSSEAEVFDPATNLWKELPGAFGGRCSPKAVVINDQIVVSDADLRRRYVCWNDAGECWEDVDENGPLARFVSDCSRYYCTVKDVETIRMITKHNRNPGTQMEKICNTIGNFGTLSTSSF